MRIPRETTPLLSVLKQWFPDLERKILTAEMHQRLEGWTVFPFNDSLRKELKMSRTCLGVCRHGPKSIGLRFSMNNFPDTVKEVFLHELAHALVGPRYGHGPVWRRMARVVGANPRAATVVPQLLSDIIEAESPPNKRRKGRTYKCADCGWLVKTGAKWRKARQHAVCARNSEKNSGLMLLVS